VDDLKKLKEGDSMIIAGENRIVGRTLLAVIADNLASQRNGRGGVKNRVMKGITKVSFFLWEPTKK